MGLNFYDNNITTDGTEQSLFDVTIDAHHACYLFTHNMVAGDSITVRVYIWDNEGSAYRKISTYLVENAQTEPAWFQSFLPSQQFKVTIQRTAGTDRNYTWQRVEVT